MAAAAAAASPPTPLLSFLLSETGLSSLGWPTWTQGLDTLRLGGGSELATYLPPTLSWDDRPASAPLCPVYVARGD